MRAATIVDWQIIALGLAMASLVLGFIGLLLFFLPILSIPIVACGLCFGVASLVPTLWGAGALRWSVGGIAICCLSLSIEVALVQAPSGYLPGHRVPRIWRTVPAKPYVPPPATSHLP